MSKFQQRHYEAIAEVIKEARRVQDLPRYTTAPMQQALADQYMSAGIDFLAGLIGEQFALDNPKFRPDLFERASHA